MPYGFALVLAAMSLGMLMYNVIEYFKEKEFSEIEMFCLSLYFFCFSKNWSNNKFIYI